MTTTPGQDDPTGPGEDLSLLPAVDTAVRVLPAELARIFGVSRQTVSRWVKKGKVTLHADGRVNPSEAARQILARSDPRRMRAQLLKPLLDDVGSLREQLGSLREQLEEGRARVAMLEKQLVIARSSEGQFAALADRLSDLVVERESDLRSTSDPDEWSELVDELWLAAEEYAEENPTDFERENDLVLERIADGAEQEGDEDEQI